MKIKFIRAAAMWLLMVLLVFAAGCGAKEDGRPPVPAQDASPAVSSPPSATPTAETAPAVVPSPKPEQQADGPQPEAITEQPDKSEQPKENAPPKKQASAPPSSAANPSAQKQNPAKQEQEQQKPSGEAVQTVAISVEGNEEWGKIVSTVEVPLKEGDTVADLLIRTLKSKKLAYDTKGSGALFYVEGIDGLFEFDGGPTHGWKYRVNGKVADISAGSYELKAGDRVEWYYGPQDETAGEPSP